jgi:peptide/nickel transport system substrate-binding protein
MGRLSWRTLAVAAASATLASGAATTFAGGAGATGVNGHVLRPQATGGVVKYAESPGAAPNYIFPVTTATQQSIYNIYQFINLMWPLIYLPNPYQPTLDYAHSMAYPPVWSKNDTVATVTLRNYKWSDGVPVTARDVVFYINLAEAEGATWGGYSGPTQFPYNLKSYTAVNAKTVRFVLKSSINPTFFDLNGIDYINPIPQHAWDKESANGPVGNYDMTAAGAKKVVAFLQKEANNTNGYTTNPLWQVIDGPWQLKSFGGSSSPDVFVPNPKFSGTHPVISEFEEIPFTSDTAEFTALKAGELSYGNVPPEDFPALPSLRAQGYNTSPVYDWGFQAMLPNLKNPQVGPILSQLYIRQVLAHLTDQGTMIGHFMHGLGIPGYGPVPAFPKGNPFLDPIESSNPYPYSVSTAVSILKAHGWQVNPGGVDVCQRPGPGGCGAGVTSGEKLQLNLLFASENTTLQEDVDLFQSDASKAGISISTKSAPFNTVLTETTPCVLPKGKGTPACEWQLAQWGGLGLSTYPSGEGVFNCGGSFNFGQFCDPQLDKYINQSTVASSLAPFKAYERLTVKDLPWIFEPDPDHIAATVKDLSGYGLTSEFAGYRNYIEPNFWTLK